MMGLTVRAKCPEADVVMVDDCASRDYPPPPTIERVIELAVLHLDKKIEALRIGELEPHEADERMSHQRPRHRLVDNAEQSGANGHSTAAVDYTLTRTMSRKAPIR